MVWRAHRASHPRAWIFAAEAPSLTKISNTAACVSPTFRNPCGVPFSMKNACPAAAATGFDEPMVISSFQEIGTHS